MLNLKDYLINEYENEYGNEYFNPMKKQYSEPKIYTANGDLSKRWYLYYSFRNPKTDKLQKMSSIYLGVNNYNTKQERLQILTTHQKNLSKLLKEGYNPFEKNQKLYNEQIKKANSRVVSKKTEIVKEEPKKTVKEAIRFAIDLKRKSLSATSFRGLNNRINNFSDWLDKNKPELFNIDQLDKKTVNDFLNYMLDKTSPANRNNFRTDLSSVFQMLEDNDIIPINFIKKIPTVKAIVTRNKTYSEELQKDIYEYLENKDPYLLLYIKFISYNFLRPIEVCRLQIKDINIKERTLQFKAKNSPLKTKIIPELLINELPDLSIFNPDDSLFTTDKLGGEWNTNENDKRNYFSKRFKRVVKDHFKLGKEYGLYSFRHTFITKLYRELVKNSSPFEAKSKLMQITGHSTIDALQKYLRDIDAELPEDYSKYFN